MCLFKKEATIGRIILFLKVILAQSKNKKHLTAL